MLLKFGMLLLAMAAATVIAIRPLNGEPKINRLVLTNIDPTKGSKPLNIALLSDLHVANDQQSVRDLSELWHQIIDSDPDIIMLAGDYINDGASGKNIGATRAAIARVLGQSSQIPVVAVLGNHDHWSDSALWASEFRQAGITVLENQVAVLDVLKLCVRGFDDAFTGQFTYVDFPNICDTHTRVTLTHDPAAAFDARVRGLVLAGHTHCGQIRLPVLGTLYVPTTAPKSAHCGLYEDQQRQVYVSAGIGTSVIPLRFLAEPQWDSITLY